MSDQKQNDWTDRGYAACLANVCRNGYPDGADARLWCKGWDAAFRDDRACKAARNAPVDEGRQVEGLGSLEFWLEPDGQIAIYHGGYICVYHGDLEGLRAVVETLTTTRQGPRDPSPSSEG